LIPGEGWITDAWKYSGTISTSPATLMTMAISVPISHAFFSTIS
jgi:hypothetical protein